MSGLMLDLGDAVLMVALIKVAMAVAGVESLLRLRVSPAAALLWSSVALPSSGQLVWPGLYAALRGDPTGIRTGQCWRLVTSIVVQDSVAGTVFNLLTLSAVALLAVRTVGAWLTFVVFWSTGILLSSLATAFDVAVAGSSGATYALAASVAGAAVVGEPRLRARAAAVIALGGALWALGNPHGIACCLGAALGMLLAGCRMVQTCRPRSSPEPRPASAGPSPTACTATASTSCWWPAMATGSPASPTSSASPR